MTEKLSSKKGFYVGDICYVLNEDIYYNFWGKKKNFTNGIFEVNGFSFAVGSTAHGDGVYYDTDCHEYPVDAGVIGLVPLELVSKKEGSGAVFELWGEAEFNCEDGVFDIFLPNGYRVHINTRYEGDENDI